MLKERGSKERQRCHSNLKLQENIPPERSLHPSKPTSLANPERYTWPWLRRGSSRERRQCRFCAQLRQHPLTIHRLSFSQWDGGDHSLLEQSAEKERLELNLESRPGVTLETLELGPCKIAPW